MPMNLPSTNCRRVIGFESSVIAVLPSISLAMLVLAVQIASSSPLIKMVAKPQSLSILMSSPSEKNGRMLFTPSSKTPSTINRMKSGCRTASFVVARAMTPTRVV